MSILGNTYISILGVRSISNVYVFRFKWFSLGLSSVAESSCNVQDEDNKHCAWVIPFQV
jgi:hypothetical protein